MSFLSRSSIRYDQKYATDDALPVSDREMHPASRTAQLPIQSNNSSPSKCPLLSARVSHQTGHRQPEADIKKSTWSPFGI